MESEGGGIAKARCNICNKELDVPNDPLSDDCGGDCLACMAQAGDPDAVNTLIALVAAIPDLPDDGLVKWIEDHVTLHTNVTFCYVVDAHQVMYIVRDDEVAVQAEGVTLKEAIEKLIPKVNEYAKTTN